MDLAHLVHAPPVMRLLRAPALHMVLLGLFLFAADSLLGAAATREELVVPRHRLERSLQTLAEDLRRPPSAAEKQAVVDILVDQEVLFRYALRLGMHYDPVVQRRLAKIASFVDDDGTAEGSPAKTNKELAQAALDLGLHKGDVVVRRILADAAARLIRAAVLVRQPSEEMVRDYYEAHKTYFLRPGTTRITQLGVNALKYEDQTAARAEALLETIRRGALTPAQAVALEEESFVPASLPPLTDKDLASRLGYRLAKALVEVPVGAWSEPLSSRYGMHLVYVHERVEPQVPPLAEIRDKVTRRLKQKLADEWLVLRRQQIRADYDIVIPEVRS